MSEAIQFAEEKQGYSKAQVDRYISMISEAYQTALKENEELQKSLASLSKPSITKPDDSSPLPDSKFNDAIAAAIVDAEMYAMQIKTKAENDIAMLKEQVRIETQRLEVLQASKDKIEKSMREIQSLIRVTLSEEDKTNTFSQVMGELK